MRSYFLYILTGLVTFWVVMFLFGVSAGFANYTPIMAIIGSALLFTVASPTLVINKRIGLIIGAISSLLILPFDIGFTISIFDDGAINWGTFLAFAPIILVSLSLFYTVKDFKSSAILLNQTVKILLFCIPILFFILYIVFYGKYWNWQMFKL